MNKSCSAADWHEGQTEIFFRTHALNCHCNIFRLYWRVHTGTLWLLGPGGMEWSYDCCVALSHHQTFWRGRQRRKGRSKRRRNWGSSILPFPCSTTPDMTIPSHEQMSAQTYIIVFSPLQLNSVGWNKVKSRHHWGRESEQPRELKNK